MTTQSTETHSPQFLDEQAPLIALSEFRRSGRSPVELHHLIFNHRASLVDAGVIVKFGSKWLLSEPLFYAWLRAHGRSNA